MTNSQRFSPDYAPTSYVGINDSNEKSEAWQAIIPFDLTYLVNSRFYSYV
jgi:hypothetical protein